MLKSIEKLRDCANIAANLDGFKFVTLKLCDEIEREIAKKYIELPLDIDGVAIRPGDTLSYCYEDNKDGEELKGIDNVLYLAFDDLGDVDIHLELYGWEELPQFFTYHPEEMNFRHCVKPRIIEDVLQELAQDIQGVPVRQETIAKYAEELRKLMLSDDEAAATIMRREDAAACDRREGKEARP